MSVLTDETVNILDQLTDRDEAFIGAISATQAMSETLVWSHRMNYNQEDLEGVLDEAVDNWTGWTEDEYRDFIKTYDETLKKAAYDGLRQTLEDCLRAFHLNKNSSVGLTR